MKKIKNFKKRLALILLFGCLIYSAGTLVYYVDIYEKQMHNVDLAHNILKDPNKEKNMYDEYKPGQVISIKNLYISSMNHLHKIHFVMIWSSFSAGICIGIMVMKLSAD